MCPRPINLALTNSLLVAIQAVAAACRFLGLGDLTLIDFKNDESRYEDEESRIRHINFFGETLHHGRSPQGIRGRVSLHRDDAIQRWVPVVCDVDAECCRAVGFGYTFDDDGCILLCMSHSHIAPGSRPIDDESASQEL